MRLTTAGNAALIVAFLLCAAGIAEPASATAAFAAFFLFVGFSLLMWESHNTWASGYAAAQLDMTFDADRSRGDDGMLWKCGSRNCSCADDPEYQPILGDA